MPSQHFPLEKKNVFYTKKSFCKKRAGKTRFSNLPRSKNHGWQHLKMPVIRDVFSPETLPCKPVLSTFVGSVCGQPAPCQNSQRTDCSVHRREQSRE